jgi:hypothetical protein
MAFYLLHVKNFSRARGECVTRAAAYRAGERIRDERAHRAYNHSKREDVVLKEITLPSQFSADASFDWARNRATLWNVAEQNNRSNARLGREILVALPPELTPAQRADLVRRFARELSDKHQNAVDATIHLPRPRGDHRYHHAHLLTTTREVTPRGLGRRTIWDLSGRERYDRGLGPSKGELLFVRERWAQLTNEALREAGLTLRVDHRGLRARGIDREPVPEIPLKIRYMERKSGIPSQAGNDIRRRYRERVEARLKGGDELRRVLQRQKEEGRQRVLEKARREAALPKKKPWGSLTKEELTQRRREYYEAHKEELKAKRRAYYRENVEAIRQKKREARLRAKPTPEQQSAQRWLKSREREQRQAAALERGQGRRHSHSRTPALTPEDSVRNWSAYRELQKQAELSPSTLQRRAQERAPGRSVDNDDDDVFDRRRKKVRTRDYDYEL